VTALFFSLAILAVKSDDPGTFPPLVDSAQQVGVPPDVPSEEPRFAEHKAKVKAEDPWWLKDVPWFLPPPPEWGPLPPQMYMSYWHKPYAPPLSTPNYYPLYSKESEFLPLAPQYPSNYPWTPGSFKGSSSPLLAVGPSIRVSPYLAFMRGGRTPPPDTLIEQDSHVYKTVHKKGKQNRIKRVKEEEEKLGVHKKTHTTHHHKKQTHMTKQRTKHHQQQQHQQHQHQEHQHQQQKTNVNTQHHRHHKSLAKAKAKMQIQNKRNKKNHSNSRNSNSHKVPTIDELVDHYAHLKVPKESPFFSVSSSLTTLSRSTPNFIPRN
jgi:hypothetical protein